jgi:hypothetical protein
MKRIACALALWLVMSSVAAAQDLYVPHAPSYLILSAPRPVHRGHQQYSGRGWEVRTSTYAYGWFGAMPRQHVRRSTGYYEGHLQWTKQ